MPLYQYFSQSMPATTSLPATFDASRYYYHCYWWPTLPATLQAANSFAYIDAHFRWWDIFRLSFSADAFSIGFGNAIYHALILLEVEKMLTGSSAFQHRRWNAHATIILSSGRFWFWCAAHFILLIHDFAKPLMTTAFSIYWGLDDWRRVRTTPSCRRLYFDADILRLELPHGRIRAADTPRLHYLMILPLVLLINAS